MESRPYLYCVRTHFSLGESLLSPKKAVQIAKRDGHGTVALVDTMTVSGMTDFISACKKEGIRPIIGCRLRIVMDLNYRKPSRTALELVKPNPEFYPKVYVKNEQGMLELMKLLSLAHSPERFYERARLSFDDLVNVLKNNSLVLSTGDLQNIFTVHEEHYNYQLLLDKLLAEIDAKNCFYELFNAESILHDTLNKKTAEIASDSAGQILATNLLLYDEARDADTLDVLSVITSNSKMANAWRNIQQTKSFCAKDHTRIFEELGDVGTRVYRRGVTFHWSNPEQSAQNLIDMCQYEWKPMPVSLPKIASDEHMEVIKQVALGWKERINKPVMGYQPSEELIPVYKKRLAYELSVLNKMGFERYFLVVQDLVKWSKTNRILVGPGRGSSAGSLVSFLMGITDVDPIRFDLLFERFINPDRIDLPDADLDFMSTRRGEVIGYLIAKYGEDRVAGISNYGTLASASALRDCGRVYGLSNEELSATRYVPKENGTSSTLTEAASMIPEIEKFKNTHPDVWNHAIGLEGCMRSLGKHAAGIVVADESVGNRAVVETRSETAVVNWDRNSVEGWGLVKIDVLGLSTLDTLRIALDYIKENHAIDIDLLSLPIDDYETLKGFSQGKTVGTFQLESGSMRHLLKELAKGGQLTFDDICATTSLYRPGPIESGMLDAYVKFRQGIEDPEYDHPKMKPALEVTGGVFVYQEQTMQVARDLAGFTMAEADFLRKAIGKKDKDKMASLKDRFVSGCIATSAMTEAGAIKVWDNIEKNASYQFNKSHAVVYSVISYWCQYLKTHYPAEFFAALLTTVDDESKLQAAIIDAKKHAVFVVPPDINLSTNRFEFRFEEHETHLVAPFNKLKGLSDKTAEAILAARSEAGGKFKDRNDLLTHVVKRNCNVRHMGVLDKVGAFAQIEPSTLPVRHPDRLKDQIELLPGLITEFVKADRYTKLNDIAMPASALIRDIRDCKNCSLKGDKHIIPTSGGKIKFMVITDSPNSSEANEGKALQGDSCKAVLEAIKAAGLKKSTGYYTSLVKAQKPKELKSFPNETLLSCRKFIDAEIAMINPAVIACLGGATIRHFFPDIKGSWSELAGRVIYSKELDASIVLGLNPQMTFFRSEAQAMLNDVFKKVYEMVE